MHNNKPNKTCINCGSNKIMFYQKYYQCDDCQRKYKFFSKNIAETKIEIKSLSCGHMEICDSYIDVYDVKIPWEDVKSITVNKVYIESTSVLYIYLNLRNGEKYRDDLKTFAKFLSYTPNKLAVHSFTTLTFTSGSKSKVLQFFQNLIKDFSDKKAIQKINIDNIEKLLQNFQKDSREMYIFIGILFLIFISIYIKSL